MDLYNKYRPTKFEDLFPTSPIIQALPALVNRVLNGDDDAIPKAMLFYSEEYGTGKTTTARLLASELNPNLTDEEREKLLRGEDVTVCRAINGARFRKIDDMSAIDEEIKYLRDPLIPSRFFYIIDEAHKITNDAQDLLLKTIEDLGSSPVYIILTSSDYSKNNSALLTRVQKYFFRSLNENELIDLVKDVAVKESFKIDDDTARKIAILSEGSARNALSWLSQYMLTRSLGTGIYDEATEPIEDARRVVSLFADMCDSSTVTWRMIINEARKAMNRMRTDEVRVEMLKAAIGLLDRPPRIKNPDMFRKIMGILIEALMQPVSYPEKTYLSAMLYLVYTKIKDM